MGKNILVVDDDCFMQTLISMMLAKDDHLVLLAGSAEEAFAILAENNVDALTCDLMMPEMDGITFLKRLRAEPKYSSLPVIAITGVGSRNVIDDACNQGVVTVLQKPFTMDDLRAAVLRLFNPNQL